MRVVLSLENARLYKEAQNAIKQREEILAVVSHDLKNPLTAILLSTQMLVKIKTQEQEKVERFIKKIHRLTEQMQRMISDLMDFTKIQTGELGVIKKRESPRAILENAFEMMNSQALEKDLVLSLQANVDLPEVECDRQRILQVLLNILGNAIKFTGPKGKIEISATRNDLEVIFTVHDSGTGIAEEELSKVFDRSWQGQKYRVGSVGLGLAIAKGIIESHGGKIWVESKIKIRNTFYFSLPI